MNSCRESRRELSPDGRDIPPIFTHLQSFILSTVFVSMWSKLSFPANVVKGRFGPTTMLPLLSVLQYCCTTGFSGGS